MNNKMFFESIEKTFAHCLDIARRKNNDYGGTSDPFANFKLSRNVGVSVERGILVRITDKMSRINTLLSTDAKVKDESIDDTINDAINYLAILKAYRKSERMRKSSTGELVTITNENVGSLLDCVNKKLN